MTEMSKLLPNEDMASSLYKMSPSQLGWNVPSSSSPASFWQYDSGRGSPMTRSFLQAIHRPLLEVGRWGREQEPFRANRTSNLDCALQIAVCVVCTPNACTNFNNESRSDGLVWVAWRNSTAEMHWLFPGP